MSLSPRILVNLCAPHFHLQLPTFIIIVQLFSRYNAAGKKEVLDHHHSVKNALTTAKSKFWEYLIKVAAAIHTVIYTFSNMDSINFAKPEAISVEAEQ